MPKIAGERMLEFALVLRGWWRTLTGAERRLMMETVFYAPDREQPPEKWRAIGRKRHKVRLRRRLARADRDLLEQL